MTQGITDLFASERGVFSILLLVACTVFVIVGKMTLEQWINYTQVIGVALVASKTVTGVVETIKAKSGSSAGAQPMPPPTAAGA